MMSYGSTRVSLAILAALLGSLFSASAARAQCGGICVYEVATPQMGSSYAGFGAVAQDAATAFLNPAGMTRLQGNQLSVGGGLGVTRIEFDPASNTPVPVKPHVVMKAPSTEVRTSPERNLPRAGPPTSPIRGSWRKRRA